VAAIVGFQEAFIEIGTASGTAVPGTTAITTKGSKRVYTGSINAVVGFQQAFVEVSVASSPFETGTVTITTE
jgi:hypothetical protein